MLHELSLAVVGADYPNKGKMPGRRFEIALCVPGDSLELRAEPENPADENAIAVYSERDVQIGYITAERAPRIRQLIRQGHTIRVVFQKATPYGAVARVAFNGEVPTLPASSSLRELEPDFYPDETYDDD